MTQNSFLSMLLTLQQDGDRAISGPANWLREPVLQVRTALHDEIDQLELAVVPNDDGSRAGRWHFFVGSPGNGKSAGAGELVRRLEKRGDLIRDSGSGKSLQELSVSDVPYRLEVFAAGQKFPYLYIAQDASVLPNPYDSEADPALALEELLSDAAERGVSVVVCTNRGVVERAFSRGHLDPEKNKQPWFKAIRIAVNAEQAGKLALGTATRKRVFNEIDVGVTTLDQQSLALGSDTFERIIVTATNDPEWKKCQSCQAKALCPFKANRDWLAQPKLRGNVSRLLLHAELYDGQVIVLREALAVLSLLLAGCPHDYASSHPCDWVQERGAAGDFFALASRRIYMSLFSSSSPFGLALNPEDRACQITDLNSLIQPGTGTSDQTNRALSFVLNESAPSTDVGVQRLLGMGRVLSALDPFSDVLPADFLDRWSESLTELAADDPWISEIERKCLECWEDLQLAAAASNDNSPTVYRWLTRWITSFTVRAGSMVEGVTTFGADLDELVGILRINGPTTREQSTLLKKIKASLAQTLSPSIEGLALTPSASLYGDWPTQALKPEPVPGSGGALTLRLKFGDSKHTIPLSTRAFIWLKRKAEREMALATFPNEYLGTARDAMLRVAVMSSYDTKDDIEIKVTRVGERPIQITRSYGGIVIDVI